MSKKKMSWGDLNILFTDPSIRCLTGAIHPGLECVFTGVNVSTVFSEWVVQLPVIRLSLESWSAQPEPGGRARAAVWHNPQHIIDSVPRISHKCVPIGAEMCQNEDEYQKDHCMWLVGLGV